MNDPIYIEKAFNTLMSSLPGLVSKRQKLSAICDFLEYLVPQLQEYTSYLEQLIPHIPEFSNPYEFTGIDPAELSHQAHLLKQCTQQTKLESSLAAQKVDSLERAVAQSYGWVGERSHSEFLDHALIPFDSSLPIQQGIHSVLVPVVETLGSEPTGRLRNIVLKLAGTTPAKQHELTPTFGILSDSSDQPGSIQKAATSANGLLGELGIHSKKKWQATVGFEHSQAWHSGESANTAISGLFFCSILEAMELREQFRLNPAVAISGGISEAGEIQSISEGTLQAKVEAAFYSWTQVLVVPQSQLGRVLARYEELKQTYSKRNLLIIGASNLRELFYDRRLTLHSKKSPLEHTTQRLWKRKFSALAILSYLVLFVTTAASIIGPIDRNPDHYEFLPNEIVLLNNTGREINRIETDPTNIDYGTRKNSNVEHDIISLYDINEDGINEVLLNTISKSNIRNPELILLSSNLEDTIWINPLIMDVEYLKHPYAISKDYSARSVQFADIDGDQDLEIVITTEQEMYFQGHLWVLDAKTGQIEQTYMSAGWFSKFIIQDFDDDKSLDVLACGHFKGLEFYGCSLLDGKHITGFTPLAERYSDSLKTIGPAKLIFGWKGTVVKEYIENLNEKTGMYPVIFGASTYPSSQNTVLTFNEGSMALDGVTYSTPVLFTFDYRFNAVAIASSDEYDIIGTRLFREKKLSFHPDALYLHAYRDSIYWWNGSDWVQEPTLNPAYLELVGEDSTYYKEWYFREE